MAPSTSNLRYDVYRNFVIPSLIQQSVANGSTDVIQYQFTSPSHVSKDTAIITGIRAELARLRSQGFVPMSY
jgi:hypothetical protein